MKPIDFDKSQSTLKTLEISGFEFNDDFYFDITRTVLKNLECFKVNGSAGRQRILILLNQILNENESSLKELELDFRTKVACNITANLDRLEYLTISNDFFLENRLSCSQLKELTIVVRISKDNQNHFTFLENLSSHINFENITKLRITTTESSSEKLPDKVSTTLWKLPLLEVIEIKTPFSYYFDIFMKMLQAPNVSKAKLSAFTKDSLKVFFESCVNIRLLTLYENPIDRMQFLKVTSKVLFGQQRLGKHYSLNYDNIEAALEYCKSLESLTVRYTRFMTLMYEVIDLFSYLTRFISRKLSESFNTLNIFTTVKEELLKDDEVFKNISKGHDVKIDIFDGIDSKRILIFKSSFHINLFFDTE